MSLTGELSDLSLAELIEFFCNQRKTGRIDVKYSHGAACFFLQSGAVIHAEVGTLRGIEAVYYALTQTNASFTFDTAVEAPAQTINQPWTSVVLEGLRRMDEGITPPNPFPEQVRKSIAEGLINAEAVAVAPVPIEPLPVASIDNEVAPPLTLLEVEEAPSVAELPPEVVIPAITPEVVATSVVQETVVEPEPAKVEQESWKKKPKKQARAEDVPVIDVEPAGILSYHPKLSAPKVSPIFSESASSGFSYGPWKLGLIFGAVVLVIAVVAVPWGWYARSKAAKLNPDTQKITTEAPPPSLVVNSTQESQAATQNQLPSSSDQTTAPNDTSAATNNSAAGPDARQVQPKIEPRVKPRTSDATLANGSQPQPGASNATNAQPVSRKVAVQVTYDENGRVTQASGGDATALRIARQKRFPAGKAGSATITIPIN